MKKILIGSIAALVLIGAGVGVAYVTLWSGKEMKHKTQAALLAAVPANATTSLRAAGHSLRAPLACNHMRGWTKQSMRVACTGTTTSRQTIQVFGAGETKDQEEYYTILVGGKPVVQNANCLGADCEKKD